MQATPFAFVWGLALVAVHGAATAQASTTSLPGPARSVVAPATGPAGSRADELWAAGANYKVRFATGMTFYPYVGGELPHQPFAWRTVEVRVGPLALCSEPVPRRRHGDTHCDFDFGDVVERYEVREDGLAQSFLLPRRPAATGDLVVVGAFDSPLHAPLRAPAHGGLTFTLPDGRAVVDYGAAVAIDADGRTTPMTTAVLGDRIELRLPAAAVAAARFPLVVDPLIGNVLLRQGLRFDDVDVLHEPLSAAVLQASHWVAECREAAAGDRDIRLLRFGNGFTGAGVEVFRDLNLMSQIEPRLALAASSVVLLYNTNGNGPLGPQRGLAVHQHAVGDTSLGTTIQPLFHALFDFVRGDVGGRLPGGGSRVLVTFQVDQVTGSPTSQVQALVYDVATPASPVTAGPFALSALTNVDQERPSVCQATTNGDWLVAFQEYDNAVVGDDWEVRVVAVSANGTVAGNVLTTGDGGVDTRHKLAPQIAGTDGRYLVTWSTRPTDPLDPKPSAITGTTLRAQRVDWNHVVNIGSLPHADVTLANVAGTTLRATGLAHDPRTASHWVAALRDDASASYGLFKLGFTGALVEPAQVLLPPNRTPQQLAVTFDTAARRFPFVGIQNDAIANVNDLRGGFFEYDVMPPLTALGSACGGGDWANLGATDERRRIGAQRMPLRLAGAPVDTVALLFLATAAQPIDGALLGAPGCWLQPDLLAPNYLGAIGVGIVGGQAATTLDLPENLAPLTLTAQWVYLVPGANALGLLASAGLTVPIGR